MKKRNFILFLAFMLSMAMISCSKENNGITKESKKEYVDNREAGFQLVYWDFDGNGSLDIKEKYPNHEKGSLAEGEPYEFPSEIWILTEYNLRDLNLNSSLPPVTRIIEFSRKEEEGIKLQKEFEAIKSLYKED